MSKRTPAVRAAEGNGDDRTAPIAELLFVLDRRPSDRRDKGRCFWHVQATGDYAKDIQIGKIYAATYLRYRRSGALLPLNWIVRDMPRDFTGVEIGFFHVIAAAAMQGGGAKLDAACRHAAAATMH